MQFTRTQLSPEEVADNHLQDFEQAKDSEAWMSVLWFLRDGRIEYRRTNHHMPETAFLRMIQQFLNDLLPDGEFAGIDTTPLPQADPAERSIESLLDCDHISPDAEDAGRPGTAQDDADEWEDDDEDAEEGEETKEETRQ